ncbi:MAG: ribosome silencing factor [Pseudanabaenaceae cyanobacterium bins.39]|nr:ribosome silencing factor [Pseudanabaenaceae cyanobacterium bins.39]
MTFVNKISDISNSEASSQFDVESRLNDPSYQLAIASAIAADDRKAEDIVLLAIGDVATLTEYFVIASGLSKTQVRAIANSIEEALVEKFGRKPLHIAGEQDGSWILLDYGDIIVHAMMQKERDYYGLEAFWGHAPKLEFVPQPSEQTNS